MTTIFFISDFQASNNPPVLFYPLLFSYLTPSIFNSTRFFFCSLRHPTDVLFRRPSPSGYISCKHADSIVL